MSASAQRKCKFCKTEVVSRGYGKGWETYCPQKDNTLCPYPPCINTKLTQAESEKAWDDQFNLREEP